MKKILIALLVIIAAVAAVSVYYVGQMDGMIAEVIEVEGTASIGSKVTVDSVTTDLAEGIASIKGLTIANAAGYSAPHAVRINDLTAQVQYQDQIIKRISINDTEINADLVGKDSNFQALLDNMPEDEPVAEGEAEDDTELTINLLEMRQAKINVNSDQLGQASFVMADFVMRDLSGTIDELSEQITESLISHITEQVKDYAKAEFVARAKEEATKRAKEYASKKLSEEGTKELSKKFGDKLKGLKIKID